MNAGNTYTPQFYVGQRVRHRAMGFRGTVTQVLNSQNIYVAWDFGSVSCYSPAQIAGV